MTRKEEDINIEKMLEETIDVLVKEGLTELEIKDKNKRIRIKRGIREKTSVDDKLRLKLSDKTLRKQDYEHKWKKITSPLTGTFYRSSAPDALPYVDVGSIVKPGQVLALLEAMKLFNEIRSDISGKIIKILPKNGELVNKGDVLFLIEPMQ
jgi:biotin carboxyl carrier protein